MPEHGDVHLQTSKEVLCMMFADSVGRKSTKKKSDPGNKDAHQRDKSDSPKRDSDLPNVQKMQWTENAHGTGTIPGHMSIRGPPASIGISGKKDKLLGITNHEVSERYIMKLQQERERNDQAVFRSLENLPITIRHLPKGRTHSVPYQNTSRSVDRDLRSLSVTSLPPEGISYHRYLSPADVNLCLKPIETNYVNEASPREQPQMEFKRAKATGPICPHMTALSICRKCTRVKRRRRRPEAKRELISVSTGILGNDSNIHAEGSGSLRQDFTYISIQSEPNRVVHTTGFQGYHLRSSKYSRLPAKKKTNSFEHKNTSSVFDSNPDIHFVNTSVIAGQQVGTFGKTFKKLPGIRVAGKMQRLRENTEVFAIDSVQMYNDPTLRQTVLLTLGDAPSPPLPLQPMHSFASDISEHIPKNKLADQRLTEHAYSYNVGVRRPFVNTRDYGVPRYSTVMGTRRDDSDKTPIDMLTTRSQHIPPGKTDNVENGRQYRNPRRCQEYDRHPVGRGYGGQEEIRHVREAHHENIGPDVQFSVRIEYKQSVEEVSPKESAFSEIVTVPRWIEKEKSDATESVGNCRSSCSEYTRNSDTNHPLSEASSDRVTPTPDNINLGTDNLPDDTMTTFGKEHLQARLTTPGTPIRTGQCGEVQVLSSSELDRRTIGSDRLQVEQEEQALECGVLQVAQSDVTNGRGASAKGTEGSSSYDDSSEEELDGGLFVSALNPADTDGQFIDPKSKGLPSSTDSGIAAEDMALLQEYTSEDLHRSPDKVVLIGKVGMMLSPDIKAYSTLH